MRNRLTRALSVGVVGALLLAGVLEVVPREGVPAAQAVSYVVDEGLTVESDPVTDDVAGLEDPAEPTPPVETPDAQADPPVEENDPTPDLPSEPATEEPEAPVEPSVDEDSASGDVPPEDEPTEETPEVVGIESEVPTIRGTAKSGRTLAAVSGTWAPAGVTLEYQWLLDGRNISNATSATHTLKPSDRGKKISVRVTGTLEGSVTTSQVSKPVTVLRLLKTQQSTIGGTSKWHRHLRVKPTGWTSGTKFTYQWYRNGKAVTGSRATKASYRILNADWCQTISVKVTGKKSGYETASKMSKALASAGCPTANKHRLYSGQRLDPGKKITSRNGKHAVKMSSSGTAYLYNHGRARWGASGGTSSSKLFLTPGGNLVVKKGNSVTWQSKTSGKGVKYAAVNSMGELGLYKANGKKVWSTSGRNGYRWNNWGTPRLSQNDGRWAGATIGYYQFGPVGCVPTAFAMAAQSYGLNVNPYTVGVQMHNEGDFNRGVAGAGGQSILAASKANALAATPLHSKNAIKKALKNNQPVIALVSGPYSITSPGSTHAVVLTGYSGGNTTVKNPWGNVNDQSYSLSTLWAYQSWDSLDRNAGAVFWAIG